MAANKPVANEKRGRIRCNPYTHVLCPPSVHTHALEGDQSPSCPDTWNKLAGNFGKQPQGKGGSQGHCNKPHPFALPLDLRLSF